MNAYQLPVLDPSNIPQIALDTMNHTHHDEVDIVNQLGQLIVEAINTEPDLNAITEKLHQWIEHTRAHFDTENQMMQQYGFPVFPIHSSEHQRVMQLLENLQQQWDQTHEIEPLADFVFNQWTQWFDQHVNSMDMVTAQFLKQAMA